MDKSAMRARGSRSLYMPFSIHGPKRNWYFCSGIGGHRHFQQQ
jgi:hypothetical protein